MTPTPKKTTRRRSTASESASSAETLTALPAETLERMAASVAGASSSGEAIKDHLAIAQELSRARLVFASSFDAAKGVLAVEAVRGRTDTSVALARPGEGLLGKAWSAGQPVEGDGVLAVPLGAGEKRWGVLCVSGARRRATPEVWRAFGAHLLAAMQAAQLRDAAVRRTRDLETAVAGLKSLERARDELLGNVSHELKSPLTTVKAYLAMAQKGKLGELTPKLKHAVEVCDRNADRLLRLINDMLLMSRLQGGRMTLADRPFGLRALAQEATGALAPLASHSGVTIQVEKAPEVFVKGDRERLLEAVAHLLENGVVYNKAGGRVDVRVRADGGVARLEVQDTGSGIHPDDLPNIFDRFYKGRGAAARTGNPGLGLAIVRQISQLHGGSVSAASDPGNGSTFTMRLPLFAGAVNLESRAAEPRDGAILLVEDDTDCREVLRQVLESEGMSVVEAPEADLALKVLAGSRPALVLLDLRLGGSDGRSILQHIRTDERLRPTPVFVISGAADSAAGFRYDGPEHIDGFFEKPLNLPRLLDRVREVVQPGAQAAGSS